MKTKWVAWILTMPSCGSWNGKWSGRDNVYAIVNTITSKKAIEKALTRVGDYYYNFGDGWSANVECRMIDKSEARKLRTLSKGFCGYEWMIESIKLNGKITAD